MSEPVSEPKACNFIKKQTLTQVLSCEFCEISKSTFFYRTPPVVASDNSLFDSLNNYHKKTSSQLKLIRKFVDTRLLLENDIMKTKVYRKANEFPVHWKSQIPKKVQKKYKKWRPISFMENQLKILS